MTGPNRFWLALATLLVAMIGDSLAFVVLSPRLPKTTTTRLLFGKPKTSVPFNQIMGMRSHAPPPLTMLLGGGGMEIGIQTAQLLLDSRRHDELKRKIQKVYPLVPDAVLDVCIDITATAFTRVAPGKIQEALKPGGMEKAQPELKKALVGAIMDQQVVRDIPLLKNKDKEAMLSTVVDFALEFVLKDAKEVLAAPEVQLQALEEQIRRVKALMGPRKLALYRIRNNPIQVTTAVALSAALLYTRRENKAIAAVTAVVRMAFSKALVLLVMLQKKLKLLGKSLR
jgi:hypothetical protein